MISGALLCACAWACAQQARAAVDMTLQDAQRAAAGNVDVSLARRALAAARGDVLAADHAPAPQLTAKASQIDLQNGIGGGNLFRDKRIDKSIGVDWTLERGGKRELRTKAAQDAVEAARADLQEAVVQQQAAASNAFYDLLAAQEKLQQVQALGEAAEQLREAADRRQRAGDLSAQDAARVQIESERARADVAAAQAERARAAIALAQLTAAPAAVRAAGDWPPLSNDFAPPPDPEERADVRAARARVRAAQRQLEGALALRKTDVTVGASLDHYPGTSTRLVELRVQVPLAGEVGYGYSGEIERARALLAQAEDQLEKVRRAAAAEVARLEQDLRAASARMSSYEQTIVPHARQVAQGAEFAYRRGALPLSDLVDARRTLRTVLLEAIAARADHARALATWQLRQRAPAEPESP